MTMNIIRKIFATTAVVISGFVAVPAMATPNPNVTLMATLDQSPALTHRYAGQCFGWKMACASYNRTLCTIIATL
jgi:hypothetical protein